MNEIDQDFEPSKRPTCIHLAVTRKALKYCMSSWLNRENQEKASLLLDLLAPNDEGCGCTGYLWLRLRIDKIIRDNYRIEDVTDSVLGYQLYQDEEIYG